MLGHGFGGPYCAEVFEFYLEAFDIKADGSPAGADDGDCASGAAGFIELKGKNIQSLTLVA